MKSNTFTAVALAYTIQTSSAASCEAKDNVKVTFYGWPDNSPPGPANAFDCGRGKSSDGEPIAGGAHNCSSKMGHKKGVDLNVLQDLAPTPTQSPLRLQPITINSLDAASSTFLP